MITDYHAKYYAHLLERRSPSSSVEKLGTSLLNATVDLNPHQIDAALFAFRSPLSRGAILADEVGLGKTIEAGLVASQLWAERKRRILAIVPTTLRSQWAQELWDKFFIPARIIDARVFRAQQEDGVGDPLDPGRAVVVCSYHFARSYAASIAAAPWDLVIIDEAHRLRNVYKTGNKIARAIKEAVTGKPKILLTATPLQNNLTELYGLVSFLDEHLFGSMAAFRAAYQSGPLTERQFQDLKRRLAPVCQRTLRRQVAEYVRYTARVPITQDFTPTDEEQRLYDGVTTYLLREKLHALPSGQRKLMTLVLRRLLASSTFAIAGTLSSLLTRLRGQHARLDPEEGPEADFEGYPDLAEEWRENENGDDAPPDETDAQRADVLAEIDELSRYKDLATSITRNAKGQALLIALREGFSKLGELGAQRKAVIFTESRRTQAYLVELLEAEGYPGEVMTLNGTNTDRRSAEIYERWMRSHAGTDRATGSRTVDLRTALVDHFRDSAAVLIATEAAAEGVNLQFCSLVVNYDLPWNPQRVEQRIGRCHRYGQKHDVVVINFLNRRNEADQRVFQILAEKFGLFEGVFGASDDILGALESGVDFERRIAEIYQYCRTSAEIDTAFDSLQREMDEQIQTRLASTRAQLLEHFDEQVHERLRVSLSATRRHLDRLSRALWLLTRHELGGHAEFDDGACSFRLHTPPPEADPGTAPGTYELAPPGRTPTHHAYRPGNPLARHLIGQARRRVLGDAEIRIDYSAYGLRSAVVEALRGASGYLRASLMTIDALERESHIVLAGFTRDGATVDEETCDRLLAVGGSVVGPLVVPVAAMERLGAIGEAERARILADVSSRNEQFFTEEIDKLERWADDVKKGLEAELAELDAAIRGLRREARLQSSLDMKVQTQRQIRSMEAERNRKRRELFEAHDRIDGRKETLLSEVESRLQQKVVTEPLFTVAWTVV